MTVYFLRRSLSLLLVVHANISLRLPLRNAIRQSTIHRRSIASSTPLLPAKATEGAVALLLLRPQCCTVAAAVVLDERFRTITMTTASVLLYKCHLLKEEKMYKSTWCNVLHGSFDRLSLHFVFLSLENALSAYLSIFSISITRVDLSAPSACYAVLVLYCFSTVSVDAVPKGLALYRKGLQAFHNEIVFLGFRAGDQTSTPYQPWREGKYIIDVLVPFTTKQSCRHTSVSSCSEQESPKTEETPSPPLIKRNHNASCISNKPQRLRVSCRPPGTLNYILAICVTIHRTERNM